MNTAKWTVFVILGIIGLIAAWDVYAIMTSGVEASISHTLIVWSYEYPVFTFLFGFVMGHLFWRMRDTKKTKEITEETTN